MVTMNTVIAHVDRVNPNVYTDEDKYEWLKTLEGLIAREVMQLADKPEEPEEGVVYAPQIEIPRDADKELLVKSPYDDIYRLYVSAMIYLHNREYDDYNNAVMVFQQRYEAYKAWYIQHHAPGEALNFRNVMG